MSVVNWFPKNVRNKHATTPVQVYDSKGFTLLEVLIALSLAGIMIAVLAESYIASSRAQRTLTGRSTAVLLARSKLAEICRDCEKASSGEFPPPYHKYQWQSREEKTDSGIISVSLTVAWENGNGRTNHVVLQEYQNPE